MQDATRIAAQHCCAAGYMTRPDAILDGATLNALVPLELLPWPPDCSVTDSGGAPNGGGGCWNPTGACTSPKGQAAGGAGV